MKRIFETIDPWKIVQTSLDNADKHGQRLYGCARQL